MSVKEDLLRQLSEQKDLSKLKSPEIVTEWRNSLRRLFDQFKTWLTEKSAKDVLRVVETSDMIKERLLEPLYQVPILRIECAERGCCPDRPEGPDRCGGIWPCRFRVRRKAQ